jgi:anti-anti-sigma regulatory factor
MFQQFSLTAEGKGQYELLKLQGYLEDTGGSKLKAHVQASLDAGICAFALDFSSIELISSPGVAALLDICGMIVDDFAGQMAVWGLDKHHSTVLEMSGFFFMAHQVAGEAEAVGYFNGE